MPKINVVKAFSFNKPDGAHFHFEPGVNEIDKETADHPWIKDGADGCIGSDDVVKVVDANAAKAAADAKAAELAAKKGA